MQADTTKYFRSTNSHARFEISGILSSTIIIKTGDQDMGDQAEQQYMTNLGELRELASWLQDQIDEAQAELTKRGVVTYWRADRYLYMKYPDRNDPVFIAGEVYAHTPGHSNIIDRPKALVDEFGDDHGLGPDWPDYFTQVENPEGD